MPKKPLDFKTDDLHPSLKKTRVRIMPTVCSSFHQSFGTSKIQKEWSPRVLKNSRPIFVHLFQQSTDTLNIEGIVS